MTHPVTLDALLERMEYAPHDGSPDTITLVTIRNGRGRIDTEDGVTQLFADPECARRVARRAVDDYLTALATP